VTTGAGKTYFAYLCMLDLLSRNPEARTVVLVPTLALLDQWYVSLEDDLNVDRQQIATYSGRARSSSPCRVNLLVINTAREIAPTIARSGSSLLVVDECHRASGPVNSLALRGPHSATLGLSATPEGTYDDSFDERVAPIIGPVVYRYGYDEAYQDGVIVPFELANVRIPLASAEQHEYDALSKRIARTRSAQRQGADVNEKLKNLLIRRAGVSANARSRVPVAIRLGIEHAGARTLVFHERIAAAEAISEGLRKAGLSVALYHSRLSDPLRRSNLRLFRRGGTDVLVTCRALDEGFNVPEARVAIIASSTASPRQRIQRLGRILRPARGKDVAKVYTLYATDAEERRLAEESGLMRDITQVTWMRATEPGGL
jgi:superfamily II DNA or RNA helicase